MIIWEPKYQLGIPKVDSQHMALVALINRLESLQELNGGTKQDIEEILKHLLEYIRMHFADEEKILEQFEYADLADHKKQHERFVEMVQGFRQRYQDGEDDLARPILHFLQDWLLTHIAHSDRGYTDYFEKAGVLDQVKKA